jgi:excisionase family DNA binding protein
VEELISIQEAAKRLGGISVWTVRGWISQGRLRKTKVGGRTMLEVTELSRVISRCGEPPRTDDGSDDDGDR